mmetsp:Transcript_1103/g.7116  ORF Transcript_1103/g.7116 Transcript_1103/m.7116 type:complete len:231 (+) Transcript_1103:362-1054(+)
MRVRPTQEARTTSTPSWTRTKRTRSVRTNAVGVPKVPYRTPGEGGYQWVDIWNVLYRERIIFLGQNIDEEFGNQIVGTMLYLDSENNKDMNVYVNCPGGDVVPSLSIHDTMKHCRSDVGTVGFGGALAMGGFLLSSGAKGKRYCLPHTKIMLHSPSGAARGQASDIENEARELLRVRRYLMQVVGKNTNHTEEQTTKDFTRDRYFTPEEAMEYGIVDQVIYPRRSAMLGL